MKKLTISDPHTGRKHEVPHALQRLCAACLEPMPIDYVRWDSENTGEIIYVCQHNYGARLKRVGFTIDKKGRLS